MKLLIRNMKRITRNIQPPRMFGGMDRAAKFSCHRALTPCTRLCGPPPFSVHRYRTETGKTNPPRFIRRGFLCASGTFSAIKSLN
jgi:hypothetical protein